MPGPTYTDLAWTKASSDFGAAVTSAEGKINFGDFLNLFFFNQKYDLGAVIRAMQQRGLFQSLAEPNLVAESGKEASFLAGGEFPVPVAQGSGANLAISVMFKEFGVRLNFTPTINGDRVHLKVKPEVSTLDFGNAVVLNGFRIPALSTRRTETEIELRNGQTFAIAGLLNNQMQSTMQKIPGIGDIPILGYLFRSKVANKEQTELVVMITPEILPTDSPGVTNQLPRMPDTFMAPVIGETGEAAAAAGVHSAVALAGEHDRRTGSDDRGAGCGQDARCQRARGDGRGRQADRGAAAGCGRRAAAASSPSSSARRQQQAAEAAAKPAEVDAKQHSAEQKRIDAMMREQIKRDAELAEKAQKEAARQAEADRKLAEKLAKEQAKRDAEAAKEKAKADKVAAEEAKKKEAEEKKQAEEAKRQAGLLQERQQEIDAAAERLRASEAAYQAELAKRSSR